MDCWDIHVKSRSRSFLRPFSDNNYTTCYVTQNDKKWGSFYGHGQLQNIDDVKELKGSYVNRKDGGIVAFSKWLSETKGHNGGFEGKIIIEININKVTWEQMENCQSGSDMNR
ncbi:hypothetical protein N7530_009763 [Penicillium desertorum]|uniref:Uncharacterized protein n=1 Tax=Penicillium desertorum TaxID=1303715 RepID=A0A9W9WJ89_9EURO|nr:hypothetical protein N7530_009763 [Penicillium desertorum]